MMSHLYPNNRPLVPLAMRTLQDIRILLVLLVALIIASCSPDTGNYTYTTLNDVEISMPSSFRCVLREEFVVEPQLNARTFKEDDYDFEWKAFPADNSAPTVLSNTRNLHINMSLPTGSYTLVYTVTERKGGFFYRTSASLQVNTPFSAGWLVLCDENGRARLDMYSDIKQSLYTDILPQELHELQGPISLLYINQNSLQESPFYLITEDGTTRLSSSDFEWKEEYRIAYEMGDEESRSVIPAYLAVNGPGKVMVDNQGNVFYCDNIMGDGLYNKKRANTFSVAPFVGYDMLSTHFVPTFMLYNETTKNFVVCAEMFRTTDLLGTNTPNDISLRLMYSSYGFPYGRYDLFTIPDKTYDLRWMENTTYDPLNMGIGTTYALMASPQKTMVFGFALGDLMGLRYEKYGNTITNVMQADVTQCTNLSQAQHIAFSSLKNMMYYAIDNKVYRVNLAQSNPTAEVDIELPVGEHITCLKFYHHTQRDNAQRSNHLIVGSADEQNQGTLRIFDGWNTEGVFQGQEPIEEIHGFAKIRDVIYREIISEYDM